MFTPIDEKISVLGVYYKARFTPKKFKWHTREYKVEEITMVSDTKDGGVRRRIYSILSLGNLYRLSFNRETETWTLKEVWCEG
ncbi:hypothetical protein HY419_01485 [candidate division WWE3 bacterium]|nr:hypothetical protein [candidate division WWE3 bacterium]